MSGDKSFHLYSVIEFQIQIKITGFSAILRETGNGSRTGTGSDESTNGNYSTLREIFMAYSQCTGTELGPLQETGLAQKETKGPDPCPCLGPVWAYLHGTVLSVPVLFKFPCSVNTS